MNKQFAFVVSLLLTGALAVAQTAAPRPKTKTLKAQNATAAEKVQLNPQPLPPGAQKNTSTQNASKVALNPQPLPPGKMKQNTSAASKVALNPQPLPPGKANQNTSAASKVALNPQPLPPGKVATTTSVKAKKTKGSGGAASPAPK